MVFEETDHTLRCRFQGDLHSANCESLEPQLAEQVDTALIRNPGIALEFDLKEVGLVTSVFLRVCIFYARKVGSKRFRIVNLRENVKRVFVCSGLLDVMSYTDKGKGFDVSG